MRPSGKIFIYLALFLPVFFSVPAYPQENGNGNYLMLGARGHYGYVISHTRKMRHLFDGHAKGFELNITRQTNGSRPWQQQYRHPVIGVSLYHLNLGSKYLGTGTALIQYISFPFVRTEKFLFTFRLGNGIGYVSKTFDRADNYKNNAIGSHINGIMHANFEFNFNLTRRLVFTFAGGMTHFSNGTFRTPNLGLNIPTLNSGIRWKIYRNKEELKKDSLPPPARRIYHLGMLSTGIKEKYPAGGRKYFIGSLSYTLIKPAGNKSHVGIGADVFYDSALRDKFLADSIRVSGYEIARAGIHLTHEWIFGRVRLVALWGGYFYDHWKNDGVWYSRTGIRYYCNKNLFINSTLKIHLATADYYEWGLGYRF